MRETGEWRRDPISKLLGHLVETYRLGKLDTLTVLLSKEYSVCRTGVFLSSVYLDQHEESKRESYEESTEEEKNGYVVF